MQRFPIKFIASHWTFKYLSQKYFIYFPLTGSECLIADFGEVSGVTGGKLVFACHHFLDYSGEARKNNIHINIEETMAILTR